jgi:hypothetical protein
MWITLKGLPVFLVSVSLGLSLGGPVLFSGSSSFFGWSVIGLC